MRYLIVALAFWSSQANALDVEIAVGRSEFCCLQDGVWWQSPFGFNGSTTDASWEIGVRQKVGPMSLHAAYLDLGSATGSNLATMRDDDFGSFDRTKGCTTDSQKNCLGHFATRQHVAGILLGAAFGYTVKGVTIEAEAGRYLYQSSMSVSILCPNCGLDSRYAFGAGGTFNTTSGLRNTPYGSIRASYKGVSLMYRRFMGIDGNGASLSGVEEQFATGLTNGPVNQFMLGVTL